MSVFLKSRQIFSYIYLSFEGKLFVTLLPEKRLEPAEVKGYMLTQEPWQGQLLASVQSKKMGFMFRNEEFQQQQPGVLASWEPLYARNCVDHIPRKPALATGLAQNNLAQQARVVDGVGTASGDAEWGGCSIQRCWMGRVQHPEMLDGVYTASRDADLLPQGLLTFLAHTSVSAQDQLSSNQPPEQGHALSYTCKSEPVRLLKPGSVRLL